MAERLMIDKAIAHAREVARENKYRAEHKSFHRNDKSNNLYDMQILDALNAQTHACANCAEADFSGNGVRIYCSNLGCYMKFENCCRDWKEEE